MASPFNVSPEKIVSATVGYTNKNESGREWDINADASISNGVVSNFSNGFIRRREDSETGTVPAANFNCGPDNTYLSITFSNATVEQEVEMLRSIYEFMSSVTENVKENNIQVSI